jgi:hypothetical protein
MISITRSYASWIPKGASSASPDRAFVSSTLRVKTIEGRIKEVTGKLVGSKVMEKRGAAK